MENKINFEEKIKAISVLKWTLRRQRAFSIAYWVLLFLTFPLINILTMIITTSDVHYGSMVDYIDTMEEWAYLIVGTLFSLVAILHSAIMGIITFSYMHNKRSVDLYGSLPVSRKTMFFSRYFALVLSNVAPIFVMGSIGALLTFKGSTMLEVYKVIETLILATVGNISFVAFISLCCGTVGDVIVSYVVVNIVYPICLFICHTFPIAIVPGFVDDAFPATAYTFFSPLITQFTAVFGSGLKLYVIWWIAFTIVLLAGCAVLCKKRKAETAQNAFAFAVVEVIIKFITCFSAGFVLGWIMTYVGNADENSVAQWIWFVFGTVIGVMVSNGLLHLIFHRGFSGYKSSLKECLVVFATDMAFLLIVTSGLWGFDSRVPDASDVESVYIGFDHEYSDEFIVDGKNLLEDYSSDKDIIESVIEAHQTMTDNVVKNKRNGLYPLTSYVSSGYNNFSAYSILIRYKLKNGRTVSRYYTDRYGYVEFDEALKHYSDYEQTVLNNIPTKYISYMFLDAEGEETNGDYYLESYDEYSYREKDVKKIVEALKKDIKLYGTKYDDMNPLDSEEGIYKIELGYKSPDYNDYILDEVCISLYVTEDYVNTLKALEETGYGNIRLYRMMSNYSVREDAKKAKYKQTGKTIYYKIADDWDEEMEMHCVAITKKNNEYEYTMSLLDDKTLCEKVADGIYKYVLPESKVVKDEISAVMFYQYSNKKMNLNFVTKMGTEEENFLYKGDSFSGEFVWGKYEE